MNGLIKKQIKYFPWHPFLLAVFPILTLLAHNIAEIKLTEATRALIVSLGVAFVLVILLRFILKDWQKAAAITSLFLVLFFSYGHVYNFLETASPAGLTVGRHRILGPLYLLVLAVGIWWIASRKRDLRLLTETLNIITLVALAFPLLQISTYYLMEARAGMREESKTSTDLPVTRDKPAPDIYYIILDAYSRDDVLKTFYDYDNSLFLDELAKMGFYVARCSQSNYAQTQLSLASALNLNFLDQLDEDFTENRVNRVGMPGLIKHSTVRHLLEGLGYKMVAFETGYYWTQVEDADVYLSPKSSATSLLDITGGLTNFEALLIKTSAGLILADGASALPRFIQPDLNYPNQIHRERVLFTLEQLGKLPAMPGPKFVFAHIVSPHRPFVFGPQGEILEQEKSNIIGYRDQVNYLNSRLIPLLQEIIAKSTIPPIIILQGDHGGVDTPVGDRMAILNAYYLPESGSQILYENITPVNTFRVVFNHFFGDDYKLLDDTSYFSYYKTPYKYTVVPNTRAGCP